METPDQKTMMRSNLNFVPMYGRSDWSREEFSKQEYEENLELAYQYGYQQAVDDIKGKERT